MFFLYFDRAIGFNYIPYQTEEFTEEENQALEIMNNPDREQIVANMSEEERRNFTALEQSVKNKELYNQSIDLQKEMNDIDRAEFDAGVPMWDKDTIEINGVERAVTNSSGKKIAHSEKSLRMFYEWFGDSKVVDEQGRPLVVYHGTDAEFDVFDVKKQGKNDTGYFGRGFYFTPSERVANYYASGKNVMPVYLNASNPLDLTEIAYKDLLDIGLKKLKDLGIYTKKAKEWLDDPVEVKKNGKDVLATTTLENYIAENKLGKKLANMAKKNGYDSILVKGKEYVVFNPNQIKSTSNTGTFSKASDNIRYQFGGPSAVTAALDKLEQAKYLQKSGVDNEAIRQQTGWFLGADKKWRFEISDEDAVMLGTISELMAKHEADDDKQMKKVSRLQKKKDGLLPKLRKGEISEEEYYSLLNKYDEDMGEILENRSSLKVKDILKHDKLFEAYPEIENISVYISDNIDPDSAYFSKLTKSITVGENVANAKADDIELKSVIMHEIQHAIQAKEGFATGGSTREVNTIKRALELHAEASEEVERIEYFNKKLGSEEKTKELLHKEYMANKALRESLEQTGDFSDEAMKENDKFLEFIEELGLTREDMVESYNTPSKKLYNDVRVSDAFDVYWRLYGEIEARNTAKRSGFTEETRKKISPETTQDVSNAEAIVMFSDGTVVAYETEKVEAVKITGKEVGEYTGDRKAYFKAFAKYYKKHLAGKTVTSPVLGKVKFFTSSINETEHHNKYTPENLKYIAAVPQIIKTSRDVTREDIKHYKKDVIAAWRIRGDVDINGDIRNVSVVVLEDKQHNRYYTLDARKKITSADTAVNGRAEEVKSDNVAYEDNITPSGRDVNSPLYQTAYYGARVDHDKPSLEAIGTGEGAQVHGWGLYYALSRYVAEKYRKAFIRSNRETVFPDSREEVAINIYLKNNKDRQATIKELTQMEKNEQAKLGTSEEDIQTYVNVSQAVDYMRYIDDATLEQQIAEVENSEKGQVFEVDIPENPYLLDEQKTFEEQSDFVKDAIRKLNNEDVNDILDNETTGEDIYGELVNYFSKKVEADDLQSRTNQGQKMASQALEKVGIKGITYDGRQDGRCFVIFNDKDVKVIEKFYQTQAEDVASQSGGGINLEVSGNRTPIKPYKRNPLKVLGQYEPTKKMITLFKGRNPTTLIHEMGHHYLPIQLRLLEKAGKWDKLKPLYKELGISSVENMDRDAEEKLIDMFTSYIYYNEAPNVYFIKVIENKNRSLRERFFVKYNMYF